MYAISNVQLNAHNSQYCCSTPPPLQVEPLLLQNVGEELVEVVQPHDEPIVRTLVGALASQGGQRNVGKVNDFHRHSGIVGRVLPPLNRKIEANVKTEFKIFQGLKEKCNSGLFTKLIRNYICFFP